MRSARFGWVGFCLLAVTVGCRTPSPDWNGMWELNRSKSTFQGPVFTILTSDNGEYRYSDGSASFTLWCDGKERPAGVNSTRVCAKTSATSLDLTRKENGIKTSMYHWELSADGKIFSSTAVAFRPDGPVTTMQIVASRISGSDGFAGKWQDTSYLQRHAKMDIRLNNHVLHISYPDAGQYVDAPLNGVESIVRGPQAPKGTTYSAQPAGRREFLVQTKRDDKVLTRISLKLSDDGRTVVDSWWDPDRPADRGTLTYEKK